VGKPAVLIGTRKGAWILKGDKARRKFQLTDPIFLGHAVNHMVLDPRDQQTLLAAVRTSHHGPTVFRSTDFGKTWHEARRPPRFRSVPGTHNGLQLDHVFWLTPGHLSQPNTWYAGSSPQGLFRSKDGGRTWDGVAGFNDNPRRAEWVGDSADGTPEGPKLHSINIDPRDPGHIYIGISTGGVFESMNGGRDWRPLNKGCGADILSDPDAADGHDPHCVMLHPLMPDRLYQQNHSGIYRMERPDGRWVRIGLNMPRKVGDIGFPLVLHPRDPNTVWVFPMDGSDAWSRTSPDGEPAAFVSRNAGKTWKRLDKGLPGRAWFTVKRQAMAADHGDPVGLYFGTTSGEVWASRNEGEKWSCLASHLPHIYSVETAEFPK
jgi:photosystem II stability/assembly factor-like uncharacterized protein